MLIACVILSACGGSETGSGSSEPGSPVTEAPPAAPDTTAPTTPSGLKASAVSSSHIALAWSPSTDNVAVTGYRVYQDGVLRAQLGTATSYDASGLAAFTTYTYRVDAVDAAGNASGASAPASASTLASNTATLEWDAVPGATGYRLYYGTTRGGPYLQSPGNGVEIGGATSYTVAGLVSRTRYYFVTTAYNSTSESNFSNEVYKDVP